MVAKLGEELPVWRMVYSVWRIVYGVWRMEYGNLDRLNMVAKLGEELPCAAKIMTSLMTPIAMSCAPHRLRSNRISYMYICMCACVCVCVCVYIYIYVCV